MTARRVIFYSCLSTLATVAGLLILFAVIHRTEVNKKVAVKAKAVAVHTANRVQRVVKIQKQTTRVLIQKNIIRPARQGVRGVKGDRGPQGRRGPRGSKGPDGPIGPIGAPGVPGARGVQGIPGFGFPGPKGETGATGPQGEPGMTPTLLTGPCTQDPVDPLLYTCQFTVVR